MVSWFRTGLGLKFKVLLNIYFPTMTVVRLALLCIYHILTLAGSEPCNPSCHQEENLWKHTRKKKLVPSFTQSKQLP